MSIRIRVYPQYGAAAGLGAYGAMGLGGAYGAYGTPLALANQKLANVRQTSNLKLAFLDALYKEKLKNVELQSQLRYGYPMGYGVQNAYAGGVGGFGGLGGMNMFGTMGLGGMLNGLF
jgi:hypothetical protein